MKTTKFKKVLIAVDYDQSSQKVSEIGFSIAKAMSADVVLLHVLAEPIYYSSSDFSPIMGFLGYDDSNPTLLDSIEGITEVTQTFLSKVKHHLGDENIMCVIAEGALATEIIKTSKEVHADVIVIGSHSRGWLEKALMGTVTENVLKDSKIPVLIVPTKKD
jgi:nucleotide-binding universal stress UspA family protein